MEDKKQLGIGIVLLISGIIFGPVYFFYSYFHSGTSFGQFKMDEGNSSVFFNLTPEMNPIAITASVNYVKIRSISRNTNSRIYYQAKLLKDGNAEWVEDFSVDPNTNQNKASNQSNSGNSIGYYMDLIANVLASNNVVNIDKDTFSSFVSTNVNIFSIDEPGEYTFYASKKNNVKDYKVTSVDFDFRKNAPGPNIFIAILGVIVLFVGFYMIASTSLIQKKAAEVLAKQQQK